MDWKVTRTGWQSFQKILQEVTVTLSRPRRALWLSGRVCDLRSRGHWFHHPHLRHCLLTLSKTLYSLLSTGSTQENVSTRLKIIDWLIKYPIKQTFPKSDRSGRGATIRQKAYCDILRYGQPVLQYILRYT